MAPISAETPSVLEHTRRLFHRSEWGLLAAAIWLGAWLLARRWRKWPAYLLATPVFLVVLFVFFVRLPAFIVLGVWIVLQFFTGVGELGTHDTGGVATFAHIGGFVAGMVLVFLFRKRTPRALPYPT